MSKKGKAPGEDLCSGNVFSAFSLDFMQIYSLLSLKLMFVFSHLSNGKQACSKSCSKGKVVRVSVPILEMSCCLVLTGKCIQICQK